MNTGTLLHLRAIVCHFLRGRVCGRGSGNTIREPAGSTKKWVRDKLLILCMLVITPVIFKTTVPATAEPNIRYEHSVRTFGTNPDQISSNVIKIECTA